MKRADRLYFGATRDYAGMMVEYCRQKQLFDSWRKPNIVDKFRTIGHIIRGDGVVFNMHLGGCLHILTPRHGQKYDVSYCLIEGNKGRY